LNLQKYVISTKRFTERHKTFDEINSNIGNYTWRYGLDAEDYPDSQSICSKFKEDLSPNLPWTRSVILNALSHLTLIKECAEGNQIMTIMEDDAVLIDGFDLRASKLIHSLPDSKFDLIQWGWNWDSFVFTKDNTEKINKIDWTERYLKLDPQGFKGIETISTLERLLHTFGTHCYSLTPQGAKKLLQFIPIVEAKWVNNLDSLGISYHSETFDGVLNAYYSKLNAYISVAPLSYVKNDKTQSVIKGT
jgi:GR25 family glycosyltransferase involved in LPS biosynthesis